MSYNVLVIPEDFRKDQHILKPLVRRMLAEAGKGNANVRVCQNPLLGGIGQALDRDRILRMVRSYPNFQLFILCVDRDGIASRRTTLDGIEAWVREQAGKTLLGENAWQELEVWLLAGIGTLPADWSWADIRAEVSAKERYFLPYAKTRNLAHLPDEGRKMLGDEAAARIDRVRRRCPEDVQSLQDRIAAAVAR